MKSLKIGVIGLGLMGERHVRVYDKMPLVELYALCDANEKIANEFSAKYKTKSFTNIEDMLKDSELDAIDIVLPDRLHLNAIELAVKYGKHICVEKPVASEIEDAQKIYELTKNYKKTFMIGHILRFDPRYANAKKSVQDGDLGDLVSLYCRRNSPISGPLHYKGVTDLSMHVMVHDIDAVQWITGSQIKSVFAKATRKVLAEYNMTDAIHAICTFENGLVGCLEACWVLPDTTPGSIDDLMEVIGTKGSIYTDSCGKGYLKITAERADATDSRHWPELNGGISGALYEELTYFVNCIINGEKSMITSLDGLSTIRVVDAIERSVKEGKEVDVF